MSGVSWQTIGASKLMKTAIDWMEWDLMPDFMTRLGIRCLLARRLRTEQRSGAQAPADALARLLEALRDSPMVLDTVTSDVRPDELPVEFFQRVLGEHLKFSACYWPSGVETLNEAEAAMLMLTCERAQLADGQTVLELGCGWGALTLWMAEHFPNSRIEAVTRSRRQRAFIEAQCRHRGIGNVRVTGADSNDFATDRRFDRVVSVGMFPQIHNYRELLVRIARWLTPTGRLFMHLCTHRRFAYAFADEEHNHWLRRYFLTGGIMPSDDLLLRCQGELRLERRWHLNGRHQRRTCETWLANQDHYREEILDLFRRAYGAEQAARWFQRWRVFFISCAELFGYGDGREWGISQYRFDKPSAGAAG